MKIGNRNISQAIRRNHEPTNFCKHLCSTNRSLNPALYTVMKLTSLGDADRNKNGGITTLLVLRNRTINESRVPTPAQHSENVIKKKAP